MTVAGKLKIFRKASNLTQAQVSQALGIDRSTYSYYELGKTVPSISMLQRLSKLFSVNLSDFLENDHSVSYMSSPPVNYGTSADKTASMAHLTKDEQDLLLSFRKLDEAGQRELMKRAKAIFERQFDINE